MTPPSTARVFGLRFEESIAQVMKNEENWRPSKYVVKKGRLRASRSPDEVGVGSRFIADIVAETYQIYIPKFARGRLLDLGCGQAPLYGMYRPHVTEVTCVDWSNSPHPAEYLDFEVDLTRELPFASGEFDTILLSDVLEHIPNPDRLVLEMARVLAPTGSILLNTPFLYWLHEEPHDYYRFTEHALRRFCDRADLQVSELMAIGGAPETLIDIVSKNAMRSPLFATAIAATVQGMARGVLRTRLGRKLSRKTSHKFPLGYFLVAQKRDVTRVGPMDAVDMSQTT